MTAPDHKIDAAALHPADIAQVQEALAQDKNVRIVGGNTKPGLTAHRAHAAPLSTRDLRGIVEYDPGEYTITALAGTPLQEIQSALAAHGQHMPFDPPLVTAGATLGGTIAAGLSGSGRQRYGSLRDFLIGVRFVDGQARLVRGGGKVVKNAAGFDLPKLMVGSRGEYGVLVEASLKVFPEPPAYGTLCHTCADVDAALAMLTRLAGSQFDLYALDLHIGARTATPAGISSPDLPRLYARLGGLPATIDARLDQLREFVGSGDLWTEDISASQNRGNNIDAELDKPRAAPTEFWPAQRELRWASEAAWLVKCASTPERARRLEAILPPEAPALQRIYTNAANSLWLAGDIPLAGLDEILRKAGLSGIVLRAPDTSAAALDTWPVLGQSPETVFHQRIRQTLDPHARLRS